MFFTVCTLRSASLTAQLNQDSVSLAFVKNKTDDTVKVNQLNQLASELIKKNPHLCLQYLEEAELAANRIRYWQGRKKALFIRSEQSMSVGNNREAFKCINEALELSILHKNAEEIVSCYLRLAEYYLVLNDSAKTYFYYNKALLFEEKLKNKLVQANILRKIAGFLKSEREYADAKINYMKAERLYVQLNDTLSIFEIYADVYNLEMEMGSFDACMRMANRALKLVEYSRFYLKIGIAHNLIGYTFYQINKMEEAKREFNEALNTFRKYKIYDRIPRAIGNLSNVFVKLDQDDSILKINLINLEELKKYPHIPTIIRANNALGYAYLMKGNITESEKYRKQALALAMKEEDMEDMANGYGNFAETYFMLKNYTKAKELILEAIELGEKNEFKNSLNWYYKLLVDIENNLGNYSAAYAHLNKWQELKKIYENTETQEKAYNESQKRKYENKIWTDSLQQVKMAMEYQKQIGEKEVELKQSLFFKRWGAGFVIILSILSAFLIYWFKVLKQQKEVIELQNARYDTLLREIHHRVKNNLQVISSIIDLEGMRQKDPQALTSYENLKPRISAVLLVHSMLYQQQRMQTINISEYFEQLGQQLMKNISAKRSFVFQLKQHIQSVNLQAEKMIPLALITIELILLSKNKEQEYLSAEIEIKKEGDFLFVKYMDHNQMIRRATKETKYKERLNWIKKLSSQCKEGIGAYYEKPFEHYSLTFKLH